MDDNDELMVDFGFCRTEMLLCSHVYFQSINQLIKSKQIYVFGFHFDSYAANKIKMASCINCFRRCCSGNVGGSYVQMREQPSVVLDTSHMGHEVVIVKNGHRVCGTGAALANVPIVQNKAYFEMKLQQSGVWGVGLATRHADLNRVPLGRDKESWVLTSEGTIVHNGNILYKLSEMPMEGDIVGISYDHVEINFYINGKNLQCPVTGAKGEVFPVLYVDDGAILDAAFTTFTHQPPLGFDRILIEKSLL